MSLEVLLARWRDAPPRWRIAACALAVAVLAIAGLIYAGSRDRRTALFANPLQPDQVSEVDAQLSAWNVAFVPSPDNIRIDARMRGELLARLAAAGVPHAHVAGTNEALESVGALTPQAVLDARARTGLEGDLEKGLRGIGGIAEARVILAPARTGIFTDEPSSEAGASVRITAVPGAVVDAATVAAVKAFVASAIPGLRPERVTVVDDRGDAAESAESEEPRRERALQSALDSAFGPDATIVRVHLERDERSRESHEVVRMPHGLPIERTTLDERFTAEKKSYAKVEALEDRGSEEREERTHVEPGAIERVSIAVIVDARRGLDLAKIREVAAAAGGIDRSRGDTLTVQSVPFDRPRAPAIGFRYAAATAFELAPIVAFAVVAVVALRVGARPLATLATETGRRLGLERNTRDAAGLSPAAVFEALREEPPHAAAAIIAKLATPVAAAVLDRYSPEMRAAIVVRLTRSPSPLLPDVESFVRDG